jgi:hypothetical protein
MRYILKRLLALAVCLQVLQGPCMTQNTIDFSKSTNLKAVYDAGLRPWGTNETLALTLTDQFIRIILPDARPFDMDVEVCTIGVMAENQLSTVHFNSRPASLSASADKTREVCKALGIPTEELDKAVATFARLGDQTPVPRYWNARIKKGSVEVHVAFKPIFALERTRGVFFVVLTFYEKGKPMKLLTEPIKPPPGYEHLSMEPPSRLKAEEKPLPPRAYASKIRVTSGGRNDPSRRFSVCL